MKTHHSYVAAAFFVTTALIGSAYQRLLQYPPEDPDAYEVDSTVLRLKNPQVSTWTIVRQTKAFPLCLQPAANQRIIYQSLFDDYRSKAKKTFALEQKFSFGGYRFVSPEEWTQGSNGTASAVFSPVGFNPERTRAVVCFWAVSDGTCSVLSKQGNQWQHDREWRGDACGWAS